MPPDGIVHWHIAICSLAHRELNREASKSQCLSEFALVTAEALWLRTCAGERGGITLDCSHLGFGPPVKHKSGKEPSQESRVIVSRDCFRVPYTHVSSRGAGPLCPLSSGSFTLFVVVRGAGPMCPLTGFGPVYHQTTSPSPASSRQEKRKRPDEAASE